jgi:hypothetical protein
LVELKHLKSLTLNFAKKGANCSIRLNFFAKFVQLERLSINGPSSDSGVVVVEEDDNEFTLPNVEYLQLIDVYDNFFECHYCPKLTELYVDGDPFVPFLSKHKDTIKILNVRNTGNLEV